MISLLGLLICNRFRFESNQDVTLHLCYLQDFRNRIKPPLLFTPIFPQRSLWLNKTKQLTDLMVDKPEQVCGVGCGTRLWFNDQFKARRCSCISGSA